MSSDLRRILITGGSGFIGTNLISLYRSVGSVELRNYDAQPPRCAAHEAHWVKGDIQDSAALAELLHDFKPTHVVHLAARTDLTGASMGDYAANTSGVRALLAALHSFGGVERAVFASSRAVCEMGALPTCQYDYFPSTYYGRSKVIGEQLVRHYGLKSEWVIVRPTSIWGPWGKAPYRDFFLSVARGTYAHPGREAVLKHYGYVGNTVFQLDRLLTAATADVHQKTLYLADPPVEVGAFAGTIRRELGMSPPRHLPPSLLRAVAVCGDALGKLGIHSIPLTSARLRNLRTTMLFDVAQTHEIVGPLPFTMEQGVAQTIRHLRDLGDLPS